MPSSPERGSQSTRPHSLNGSVVRPAPQIPLTVAGHGQHPVGQSRPSAPGMAGGLTFQGVDQAVTYKSRRTTADDIGHNRAASVAPRPGPVTRADIGLSACRNAVPTCTPLAPSANAAAIPRPLDIDPAAMTGTDTAATTCGNNANKPGYADIYPGECTAVTTRFRALCDDRVNAPASSAPPRP